MQGADFLPPQWLCNLICLLALIGAGWLLYFTIVSVVKFAAMYNGAVL